jgi:PhnB protein
MAVIAYINFKGNCREAVAFYADVFGTEPEKIMTYGEKNHGFPLPEAAKDLVMHAELQIMGSPVMFSDVLDNTQLTQGNTISLTVTSTDKEALQTAFHKLKVGGQVVMDLQQTFWSSLYGFVIDKYGIGWQFSHEDTQPRATSEPGGLK